MKFPPTIRLWTCVFLLASQGAWGQSLLDLLATETEPAQWVTATFKDTRIINTQSNETPAKGVLHFVIAHRFGRINDGAYALWGLDNASMRMAFDYGVTDRLACSIARSTYQKTYEASLKWKALRQLSDDRIPLSITLYSVVMANGLHWENPEQVNYFTSRLSFTHQAIIARKFNDVLSLAMTPSLTHRNLVSTTQDAHDQFNLGVGGRYKLSARTSINAEYHWFISGRPVNASNSLSIGMDIETGGHVFQLHLTNSPGMFERAFLTETFGKWSAGDIFFGFNLSRVFNIKR